MSVANKTEENKTEEDKKIETIKLPWNMPYCSLARAVKLLNGSRQKKAANKINNTVLIEDFIYWEQQAYFKALIPINSIATKTKINFSISKQDLDDEIYVNDDAFKEYLEGIRLRSMRTQGHRIGTLDFFEIEPFEYPEHAQGEITGCGYVRGYVHANSYILNSLPDFDPDLHVEIIIKEAEMQMRVDLDYFRWDGIADPDLEIFQFDWLNKVMICEKELNRLNHRLIAIQNGTAELEDELTPEVHGNTLVNQEKDRQILTYARELLKTYPSQCKTNIDIARLMFSNPSKEWESQEPPRKERHIVNLLSAHNVLNKIKKKRLTTKVKK